MIVQAHGGITGELMTRAMAGFWPALAVVDPIRIQAWDDKGLTIGQLRLMSMLLPADRKTVGELATALNVRPPTVTGVADRLVRRGLIERLADAEDRRLVRLALTEGGLRTMREIEDAGRAFLAPIFERLGPERVDELIRIFDEFVEAARSLQLDDQAEAAGAVK